MSLRRRLNLTTVTRSLSSVSSGADPFLSHPSHNHLSSIKSKSELVKSYTVTPPIKPWPQNLYPKRLVSMITSQQNLDLALQIFHHAGKYHPNFFHNYDTYNAIINKLARARAFQEVEILLGDLLKLNVKCGENLFIGVIRNYGIASRPKQALEMFLRIKDFGVETSVRSFNTLLNALIQNKQYKLVHMLFKNCKKRFNVVPNVFTCNILLKGFCKSDDIEGALKVLDEMPEMGMVPNVVSYTTTLGGFVSRGDMDGAKKVFDEILDRGWIPDATTYTILMDGFCKTGKLIEAVKVMDEMEENGIEPNDVTYGVMIEAFCLNKKSGEAVNLLQDMLEKKYVPDSVLCCKLIDLLCEEGKVEDACDLWKKLLRKNVTPDNAISSTLIYWLCKDDNIVEAKKLFDEFEKSSFPSVLTYNTLIAGMCEKGELCEAGRLWDDMVEKGCTPNSFTYNMLIKGFCKVGKAKDGIKILEEMLDKGCFPNRSTYSILVEGLYDSGQEAEVPQILALAASSVQGIDTDTWEIIISRLFANLDQKSDVIDRLLQIIFVSMLVLGRL
nr:PREDICTED: pentatricopeptide repeat-containing protein At5g16420, mitochondrial-like isoform X1 [Daucus carota subsp. sativus]XP_017234888.1 PREDICTED: pentatricopeptide repeat-containing protein At5g16420, mitochondrial-like isoform X1 [Daucus carota subsp. sativus]XP_017234889.1 PREDICTED: pentatricopeptide repeat-containing protein At5g16420, mitochondrial-like isoform X1 [Daucus carota subsp. sativus]